MQKVHLRYLKGFWIRPWNTGNHIVEVIQDKRWQGSISVTLDCKFLKLFIPRLS